MIEYIKVVSKKTDVLVQTTDTVASKYSLSRYNISKDNEFYSIVSGNILFTDFSYALINKYNEILIDTMSKDRLENFLEFLLSNDYNIKIDVTDFKD